MKHSASAALILIAISGCAHRAPVRSATVAQIGASARENAIRARVDYNGEMAVTGRVVDMGIFTTQPSTIGTKVNDEASVPLELLKRQRESPYVVLADDDEQTRVYCFFAVHRAPDAAALSKGQVVTLEGIFSAVEVHDRVIATAWYCLPKK